MEHRTKHQTVSLNQEGNAVEILDQTLLPNQVRILQLKTAQEIWDAIYLLKVRGAPAIGVTAALGIYILVKNLQTEDYSIFLQEFTKYKEYLESSRPTAVNLSWALNRMEAVCKKEENSTTEEIKERLKREALAIQKEDIKVCRKKQQ